MTTTPKTFGLYAAVVGWHDGDTFYGAVDQGIHTFRAAGMRVTTGPTGLPLIVLDPERHRIWAIDAPELATGAAGRDATAYAAALAPPGIYPATSYKLDNFGRPMVDLQLPDGSMFGARMLEAGQAGLYRP